MLRFAFAAAIAGLAQFAPTTVQAQDTAGAEPFSIPGPRTCFWARGPHSADPYINIAYPDANVFYWAAVFSVPEGAELRLEGEFPHSRYMSLISYDEAGRPVESVADYLIAPKDGHVNPFFVGAERNGENRSYTLNISGDPGTGTRPIGERGEPGSVDMLNTPPFGPGQQLILYRIYLPDGGTAPTGGVDLPEPVVTMADGTELTGGEACAALRTRQPLAITLDSVGIPAGQYRDLISQPGKPDTWPAKTPADWFIQLDRESLIGMYTGDINPDARRSEGGFFPNLDNHYIRTIVNRKHGKVFLIRGKAPTTPNTFNGDTVTGDGDLRYWSVCSNQSFANTRVNDCLFDEEIPVGPDGFYTVVVSREEDRPRNATPECGIGWLPMAEDGDGVFDEDVTVVQFRHMLTHPDFAHSIQRVERQEDLTEIMGPYMPRTRCLMPNQVETFIPCYASIN